MKDYKFKREYLFINILLIMIGICLLCLSFFISDRSEIYYIGVISRIVFGIFFIFNGIWNCSSNYYSIVNNKSQEAKKTPKWAWILIIALGVGMLITAFMGYSFNGVYKPN